MAAEATTLGDLLVEIAERFWNYWTKPTKMAVAMLLYGGTLISKNFALDLGHIPPEFIMGCFWVIAAFMVYFSAIVKYWVIKG